MQKYQKCSSNSPVTYVCVSKNCKDHAFMCEDTQCCSKQLHNSCIIQLVDNFNQLFISGPKHYQIYFNKVNNFYNNLFEQIQSHREDFLQFTKTYDESYRKLIQFRNQTSNSNFQGNNANHLFGAWNVCTYDFTKQSQTEMDKIESNILKDLNTIRKLYTHSMKKVQGDNRCSSNSHYEINSSIVWKQEDQNKLFRFFPNDNKIKEFNCLYRASNNNFSAAKFHQLCDGINNTLTLIRNTKDVIIGGFSVPSWQADQLGKYKADNSGKSFVFSITNDEKIPLVEKQYAIECNKFCGPIFGRGSAVWIYDKADENSAYWHILPSTYKPQCEQWSEFLYQSFIGTKMYENFTIAEWEVFEVIFEN